MLIRSFDYKETDKNNFNFKKELTSVLLNLGYDEYEVKRVFKFLNFIMEIKNKELRSKFYQEVKEMSGIKDYKLELTDFEEVALEIKVKEKSKEIAKNLKSLNIEIEKIAHATGLSIEEIEKL